MSFSYFLICKYIYPFIKIKNINVKKHDYLAQYAFFPDSGFNLKLNGGKISLKLTNCKFDGLDFLIEYSGARVID